MKGKICEGDEKEGRLTKERGRYEEPRQVKRKEMERLMELREGG